MASSQTKVTSPGAAESEGAGSASQPLFRPRTRPATRYDDGDSASSFSSSSGYEERHRTTGERCVAAVKASLAALVADLRSTWLNLLFLVVPPAIVVGLLGLDPTVVFVLNIIALVPLAGPKAGARTVPVIIGVLCVLQGQERVLQSFLVGCVLSHILLGIGITSVFSRASPRPSSPSDQAPAPAPASGITAILTSRPSPASRPSAPAPTPNPDTANTMISMLITLSSPLFIYAADLHDRGNPAAEHAILLLSRAAAFVALALYALWSYPRRAAPAAAVPSLLPLLTLPAAAACARFALQALRGATPTFGALVLLPLATTLTTHVGSAGRHQHGVETQLGAALWVLGAVLPVVSLGAWAAGEGVGMHFPVLEVVVLGVGIGVAAGVVRLGERGGRGGANWFTGMMGVGMYGIVVMAFAIAPEGVR
ncbi:hypothetical protein EDC01DRAFT_272833 [Geopyxis carbonaria]|nr:hypothetical protein EDC01DRAFT_272833 [Geopyxis carbonaria]